MFVYTMTTVESGKLIFLHFASFALFIGPYLV